MEELINDRKEEGVVHQVWWHGYDYFKTKTGKVYRKKVHRAYGKYPTTRQAYNSMFEWWNKNKYKPKYIRLVPEEDEKGKYIWIDYGLHTCFYHIRRVERGKSKSKTL
nr:MAG TPA: hypothetical protein [Bacteriophage sp.]